MARRQYTSKPAAVEPFVVDGVEFTPGTVNLLDITELGRHADLEANSLKGMVAIGEFFASLLGDDYDRFREHCRTHRTDPETLLQVISDIVEDVAGGFPTQRPSASPPGPTRTGRGLRVVSLSEGSVTEVPVLTNEQIADLERQAAQDTG